jgi:hypothetical protein
LKVGGDPFSILVLISFPNNRVFGSFDVMGAVSVPILVIPGVRMEEQRPARRTASILVYDAGRVQDREHVGGSPINHNRLCNTGERNTPNNFELWVVTDRALVSVFVSMGIHVGCSSRTLRRFIVSDRQAYCNSIFAS